MRRASAIRLAASLLPLAGALLPDDPTSAAVSIANVLLLPYVAGAIYGLACERRLHLAAAPLYLLAPAAAVLAGYWLAGGPRLAAYLSLFPQFAALWIALWLAAFLLGALTGYLAPRAAARRRLPSM